MKNIGLKLCVLLPLAMTAVLAVHADDRQMLSPREVLNNYQTQMMEQPAEMSGNLSAQEILWPYPPMPGRQMLSAQEVMQNMQVQLMSMENESPYPAYPGYSAYPQQAYREAQQAWETWAAWQTQQAWEAWAAWQAQQMAYGRQSRYSAVEASLGLVPVGSQLYQEPQYQDPQQVAAVYAPLQPEPTSEPAPQPTQAEQPATLKLNTDPETTTTEAVIPNNLTQEQSELVEQLVREHLENDRQKAQDRQEYERVRQVPWLTFLGGLVSMLLLLAAGYTVREIILASRDDDRPDNRQRKKTTRKEKEEATHEKT